MIYHIQYIHVPYWKKSRNVGFHNVAMKNSSANKVRHDVRRTLPFRLPDLSGCTLLEVGDLQETLLVEVSLKKQVLFQVEWWQWQKHYRKCCLCRGNIRAHGHHLCLSPGSSHFEVLKGSEASRTWWWPTLHTVKPEKPRHQFSLGGKKPSKSLWLRYLQGESVCVCELFAVESVLLLKYDLWPSNNMFHRILNILIWL